MNIAFPKQDPYLGSFPSQTWFCTQGVSLFFSKNHRKPGKLLVYQMQKKDQLEASASVP